jgi:hypothetical protein
MAAKRGRKPKPYGSTKSAVFSTRIDPDLRAKLEQAAKLSGGKLSGEISKRLRGSFGVTGEQDPMLRALYYLFSQTALRVGPDWRKSLWHFQALKKGINVLLDKLVPDGKTTPPAKFLSELQRSLPEYGEMLRSPEAFGALMALTVWNQFVSMPPIPGAPSGNWHNTFPAARKALDVNMDELEAVKFLIRTAQTKGEKK